VRIQPDSFALTLLLGLLSSLPTFGIDMILPTLSATGADLGVPSANVGLTMSTYLLGLGLPLSIYGPMSDRYGRKPIVQFGCGLMIVASIGCMFAQSLPQLLVFRALQGAGASGPAIAGAAIVSDLFEGEVARAKMSNLVFGMNTVLIISPTIGAALLGLGSWRFVYMAPMAGACALLLAMSVFAETARIEPGQRLSLASVARDYVTVLTNPICVGNILCNAGAMGLVFACVTGSSLFFITALGFSPAQYGLIFGASPLSIMGATLINKRLGAAGVSPGQLITLGLIVSTVCAASLLIMALAGYRSSLLVILVMIVVPLGFGLVVPNAAANAMQPLPKLAGSVSAVAALVQTIAAASSSALVAALFDGHSAFSMAVVMMFFGLLAIVVYVGVARPAEQRGAVSSA
jgi:MFS transporter, DHA1 family, multidrug resistance protein